VFGLGTVLGLVRPREEGEAEALREQLDKADMTARETEATDMLR